MDATYNPRLDRLSHRHLAEFPMRRPAPQSIDAGPADTSARITHALLKHGTVPEPASGRGANQERDVGLRGADDWQRERTAEMRVALLVEAHHRRIYDHRVAAGGAAVGIADQRSFDLSDGAASRGGVTGYCHTP